MKRLGQARGRACAPAHWLVLAPDPVSGPRVPGRCHHPSSQPPLPPAPLTSLLRVPSPRQRLTLGAGQAVCGRAGAAEGAGERGWDFTLRTCAGEREGAGTGPGRRERGETPAAAHPEHGCRRAAGDSGPSRSSDSGLAAAAAPLPGGPRCAPGARCTGIRAPGSCAPAESVVSAAPCLRLAARGQLRSCGAGRGAGSGRAAGRRRRRAPASRRASRRPGRRCLLLLAGVESGRPCPGAGLADATEPLSPPAAALSCCPKWKRKPWDWRGRMGTRGRCRKTCKVSGRGALAPAATAPRAPRTWSWRRRRRAPPQGRHRSFGLSNRARWGIRQAMPDRPLPIERRFQLPGNPSRRLRPKGCGKGRSC